MTFGGEATKIWWKCGMLKGHKYFHSTSFTDKTNNFPKKSKNPIFGPFLTIFGHLCQKGIFQKKKTGSVTHIYIWAPNTIQSLRKKILSQFQENWWKEGWKDRQTEGQTLINWSLLIKVGSPTSNFLSKYIMPQSSDSTSKASSSFCHKSDTWSH